MANNYVNPVDPGWIGGAQMPGQPDLIGKFLTGFQVFDNAAIKNQQANQMVANAALRVQQMQHENTMREGYFNLATLKQNEAVSRAQASLEFQKFKEQEDTRDKDRKYDMAIEDQVRKGEREDRLAEKMRSANEAEGGAAGVLTYLTQQGIPVGHPDFYSKYTELMQPWLQHSAAVKTTYANTLQKSQLVRDDNQRVLDAAEKRFNENIGQTLGGGNVLEQNKQWYLHPEDLPDVTEGGFLGIHQLGGVKTDKKQITLSNGNTITVHMADIVRLQQQAADLEQKRRGVAAPIHLPDIGVYNPEPAPANKADMKANHAYTFPTGVFLFTGTDLVPVGQSGAGTTPPPTYRPGSQ
jgi:hypothetical protein